MHRSARRTVCSKSAEVSGAVSCSWERSSRLLPRRRCRRCGPRSQTHGCASSGARYGGSWRSPGPVGVVGSAACGWLLLDACRLLRVVTCLGCPDRGTLSVPPAGAAVARVQPPKLWSESVGFHKAIIYEHVVGLGRVRVRLTTRAVGLKSSLVEGHVPRKLIGYPINAKKLLRSTKSCNLYLSGSRVDAH